MLSRTFNVSVDELFDNDVRHVLVERVSNTENLIGIIIKILKVIGVKTANISLVCSLNNNEYYYYVEYDGNNNLLIIVVVNLLMI